MQNTTDYGALLKLPIAKAALLLFLMTVSSPVLAMSQLEGRREARTVFVQTESLRRRRRALDRYYEFPESRFVYIT